MTAAVLSISAVTPPPVERSTTEAVPLVFAAGNGRAVAAITAGPANGRLPALASGDLLDLSDEAFTGVETSPP